MSQFVTVTSQNLRPDVPTSTKVAVLSRLADAAAVLCLQEVDNPGTQEAIASLTRRGWQVVQRGELAILWNPKRVTRMTGKRRRLVGRHGPRWQVRSHIGLARVSPNRWWIAEMFVTRTGERIVVVNTHAVSGYRWYRRTPYRSLWRARMARRHWLAGRRLLLRLAREHPRATVLWMGDANATWADNVRHPVFGDVLPRPILGPICRRRGGHSIDLWGIVSGPAKVLREKSTVTAGDHRAVTVRLNLDPTDPDDTEYVQEDAA